MPTPLEPLLVADRIRPLGARLLDLLHGLSAEAWACGTVAGSWRVRDVVAHLLDTACRRLSVERDGHRLPPPSRPIESYADLVALLDSLNATWVAAAARVSPRLLVELLEPVEGALADHLEAADPFAPAAFPVAWAGEEASPVWFDVARELTERWHHQQQIRLAVGAAPLDDPWTSRPVLEAFLLALPFRFRELAAPEGTGIEIEIRGRERYLYTLSRRSGRWSLLGGGSPEATAAVRLDEEAAWLLFTKGLGPEGARRRSTLEGDPSLVAPFFRTVAVMG